MVWRTVIGRHPTGNIGLFVSKPDYDAAGADPMNRSAWMFSSSIDKQANMVQTGRCNLNDTVTFPDMGAVPIVFFDVYNAQTGYVQESETYSDGNSAYTTYRVSHLNNSQFQIIRQAGSGGPPANSFFRYIVFSLSQDG